jgi:hypothetical protein
MGFAHYDAEAPLSHLDDLDKRWESLGSLLAKPCGASASIDSSCAGRGRRFSNSASRPRQDGARARDAKRTAA